MKDPFVWSELNLLNWEQQDQAEESLNSDNLLLTVEEKYLTDNKVQLDHHHGHVDRALKIKYLMSNIFTRLPRITFKTILKFLSVSSILMDFKVAKHLILA